jgi:tRNA threonylcarbamoyladenosine biosynthesis protein TsaE
VTPPVIIRSDSPEYTLEIGRKIGALLENDTIITLVGEFGAGKTWLAKGIAFGLGVPSHEYVNSPAYDLAHEYHGRLKVIHIDLYRLEHLALDDVLMVEEYFNNGGICLIEWANRLDKFALPEHMTIEMKYDSAEPADPGVREIVISQAGTKYTRVIETLGQMVSQ